MNEYRELLSTHVDTSFAKNTKIEELLLSPLGVAAFVPSSWTGIKMDPVTLKTKDTMPEKFKPPPRNVNPKIWDVAKKEFERLKTYFYVPSDSPRVSPVVIAPKATSPFIRFAGDYSIWVNKHMLTGHWPIPNIRHALEKIKRFELFSDCDLTNGFHQIPLSLETSMLLSVQTPWGTVRPLFLPEGVPQGSGLLQQCMDTIFSDFEEWTIVIFDNLLVLGHDYDDMYVKMHDIITRAVEHNLVFKMKKTWLGVKEVTFFGYICREHTFRLSEERLKGISDMQMPMNKKAVKRFLGCAGFFIPFVPNYSSLVAPLHDMTKESFDWNKTSWKLDYEAVFENFKLQLRTATALFYPDYDLDWILRADASELGVGCVLMQVYVTPDGTRMHQPLLFASQKFSDQARKWSTYAQEAYAMYFAFKASEYYIRGKSFVYEGDHANLQWMERSTESKVIRQRLYMQNFPFMFNHIPGTANTVSDWESRFEELFQHSILDDSEVSDFYSASDALWPLCISAPERELVHALHAVTRSSASKERIHETPPSKTLSVTRLSDPTTKVSKTIDPTTSVQDVLSEHSIPVVKDTSSPDVLLTRTEMLRTAHRGRAGHLGIRRTYETLNLHFPGHGISMSQVTAFKESCPECQKSEDYMSVSLVPITRHLKTNNPGKVVGLDYLKVVKDQFGNVGVYVFRDHFTKFVYLFPTPSPDSESAVLAIFLYSVLYGAFDVLMTDPGSELMSVAVSEVNKLFGIHHRVSLVDRHESNGVEGANKHVIRLLEKLFLEERIKDTWSSPINLGWVMFIMNKFDSTESGYSPYDLTFGTISNRRFEVPGTLDAKFTHKYVQMLDHSLKTLTSLANQHQQNLVIKRVSKDLPQNTFQRGDLVLFRLSRERPKPHKLHPIYLGPYEVLQHVKNDVEVRHLATHKISEVFVGDLKAFFGSLADGKRLASVDADQFIVSSVDAYRGNPLERSSMYFHVTYSDGDKLWMPWSLDLQSAEAYHTFCTSIPCLRRLGHSSADMIRWIRDMRSFRITLVKPSQNVLVDVRSFGADWYATLALPDPDFSTYVVPCTYGSYVANQKRIILTCPLLRLEILVDNVFVTLYGSCDPPVTHVLVDSTFVQKHKSLLSYSEPQLPVVKDFEHLVGVEFYDTDARTKFLVTRVASTRTRDIVAFVRPILSSGRIAREDKAPFHVADVENMVRSSNRT